MVRGSLQDISTYGKCSEISEVSFTSRISLLNFGPDSVGEILATQA